jgi:hypothetical protein
MRAGLVDHRGPARLFLVEVAVELAGRAADDLDRRFRHVVLDLRLGERRDDGAMERFDRRGRRPLRRQQSHPDVGGVIRKAGFGERRQFGHLRRAARSRHRERTQLAGADETGDAGEPRHDHRHATADDVAHRRCAAAVGHMVHLEAGHRREHRGEEMLAAAVAGRREVHLARMRFHVGDELADGLHRQRRIHREHALLAADQRDRREILDRIVGELRVHRRADRVGLRRQQQRVAVGRRARDALAADRGARARLVLDVHRLAETSRHRVRDHANRAVDGAARGKRHDDLDRPRREVIAGRQRGRREHAGKDRGDVGSQHRMLGERPCGREQR